MNKKQVHIENVISITQGSIIQVNNIDVYKRKVTIRTVDNEIELQLFSRDKESLRPNTSGFPEADTLVPIIADEILKL